MNQYYTSWYNTIGIISYNIISRNYNELLWKNSAFFCLNAVSQTNIFIIPNWNPLKIFGDLGMTGGEWDRKSKK